MLDPRVPAHCPTALDPITETIEILYQTEQPEIRAFRIPDPETPDLTRPDPPNFFQNKKINSKK